MNRKFLLVVIFLASILTIVPQSCENNNESDLYGEQECDTTNITWESKIADILAKNCVDCHDNGIGAVTNVRHGSYAEEKKIVDNGRLKGAINHLDGYSKMPKDRGMLPECELRLINKWIDNGAPEN